MLSTPPVWNVKISDPSWTTMCHPGWERTRENSLRLRDFELWLVWRGRGWMQTHDRRFALLPGFCAIMRPGGIYDAGQDDRNPIGLTFVHFDVTKYGQPGKTAPAFCLGWPEFFQIDDLDYFNGVMRRIVQVKRTRPDLAAALLKTLLEDLLQRPPIPRHAIPAHHARRTLISAMIAEIHSNQNRLPEVREMARQVGLSPSHFSRVFHEVAGQSPRDFLLETRLLRARHFLTESDFSIQEISERLGYSDMFFFSRQFKEKIGISPSSYRRQIPR